MGCDAGPGHPRGRARGGRPGAGRGRTWLGLLHLARTKPAVRTCWCVARPSRSSSLGTDALFYERVKAADAIGSRLWKGVYATLVGFGTCKLLTAFAS